MEIEKKHPFPWVIHNEDFQDYPCIRDANDSLVLSLNWDESILLEFIMVTANYRYYKKQLQVLGLSD